MALRKFPKILSEMDYYTMKHYYLFLSILLVVIRDEHGSLRANGHALCQTYFEIKFMHEQWNHFNSSRICGTNKCNCIKCRESKLISKEKKHWSMPKYHWSLSHPDSPLYYLVLDEKQKCCINKIELIHITNHLNEWIQRIQTK